jgi:hypothetical protein
VGLLVVLIFGALAILIAFFSSGIILLILQTISDLRAKVKIRKSIPIRYLQSKNFNLWNEVGPDVQSSIKKSDEKMKRIDTLYYRIKDYIKQKDIKRLSTERSYIEIPPAY